MVSHELPVKLDPEVYGCVGQNSDGDRNEITVKTRVFYGDERLNVAVCVMDIMFYASDSGMQVSSTSK